MTRFQLYNVRYTPASISIKHLLDHGQNSNTHKSFLFLKKELPTRLANMIMELQVMMMMMLMINNNELQLLPEPLRKQRECAQILNDYISSFQ